MSSRWVALTDLSGEELHKLGRREVTFVPTGGPFSYRVQNKEPLSWLVPPTYGKVFVRGWAVYDQPTGGNQICFGDLMTEQTIEKSDTLQFLAGALQIWSRELEELAVISDYSPCMTAGTVSWYPKVEELPKAELWQAPAPIEDGLEGWFTECPFCHQKVAQGAYHNCGEGS